jgi:hypothetical protein
MTIGFTLPKMAYKNPLGKRYIEQDPKEKIDRASEKDRGHERHDPFFSIAQKDYKRKKKNGS